MVDDIQTNPEFTADKPIQSLSKDEFGRQEYVEALAAALANSTDQDGLVMGISGPWGSGKTSLKNMIKDELQHHQDEENAVHVVEFDPWMYSGSDKLVSLLFFRISEELSPKSNRTQRIKARASKILSWAASSVKITSKASDSLSVTFTGELVAEEFKRLSKVLDPINEDIDKLSKRREELSKKLLKFNGRIFVFIDDLDRLLDNEIVDMLRAVKAVGDLPRMTYVLLYDRSAVTNAVDSMYHNKGDEYLEKIIQVPIELPTPPQNAILERLNLELTNIVGPEARRAIFPRLDNLFPLGPSVYDTCVVPFLENLRDAIRLANEFRIRYAVLKDDVEITDFLGITSLEVFRPELHRWIMHNKELLCSPVASKFIFVGTKDPNEDRSKRLKSLLSGINDLTEIAALESLFPSVGCIHQGSLSGATIENDDPHRSICQREHFDAYFRLSIDADLHHEDDFKRLLLKDELDENNIDNRHLEIVKDRFFPSKAALYLCTTDSKRVAEVVGYCLQCDYQGFKTTFRDSISTNVATAILNGNDSSVQHVDLLKAIVQAIERSDSPAAAPVAAWLALQISFKLNNEKPDSEKDKNLENHAPIIHSMEYDLLRIPLHRENRESWDSCLADLKNKLKHLPKPFNSTLFGDELLLLCTSAITLLFNSDEEIRQAFESLRPLVETDQFSLYVAHALTEEVNGDYEVKLSLLEELVPPQSYLETINGHIASTELWDYAPRDHNAIAAYYAIIKDPDIASSVSREKAEQVLNDWVKQINEARESHD